MKPKSLHQRSENEDQFLPVDITSDDFSHPERLEDTFSTQSHSTQSHSVVDKTGDYIKSDHYYHRRLKKQQENITRVTHLTAQEIEKIFDSVSTKYGIAD